MRGRTFEWARLSPFIPYYLLITIPFDEGFHFFAADIVAELFGRCLEEIGGGTNDGTAQFAVQRDLGAADGVDHHARRVGAVPYFELDLDVERNIAEGRAFHADVCPLAVGEPGYMIRWAHMDIIVTEVIRDHAGHRVGLGDLLAFQAFALEHVEEVCIAAKVELIGAVDAHAAIDEERGKLAMQNGRADLTLDVIAKDGKLRVAESLCPIFRRGNEHRNAVDKRTARFNGLLHIPFGCHLGTNRQEVDDNIGLRIFEQFDDIGSGPGRFGDHALKDICRVHHGSCRVQLAR